jgi:hypothetical protein
VAVYLSPLRSLVDADLSECFSGGKPGILPGDLNAKHKDWTSRLNSPRGVLLREFASVNSCIIHGPDSSTTISSWSTVMYDVLDIVVVKDFVLPVNLTLCSAFSSDNLPFTVDVRVRSSFQALPDRPCLQRISWTHFQGHLSDRLNGNPRVDSVEDIDARIDELTSVFHEAMSASAPNSQATAGLYSAHDSCEYL